ncbi:MAG: hypothetical protein M0Z46_08790 [Actinomycetota bacterium]|nr:hypothetical protein [Actinomycetota bacterium]
MRILGIDPGGRETGMVVVELDGSQRRAPRVARAVLIERGAGETEAAYVGEVVGALRELSDGCRLIAVEGLVVPTPHLRVIALSGLLGAAVVLGAVLATAPSATVVPPGGNGSGPLRAYPGELVGPGERAGAGWRRHLRSAWDIALAAASVERKGAVA